MLFEQQCRRKTAENLLSGRCISTNNHSMIVYRYVACDTGQWHADSFYSIPVSIIPLDRKRGQRRAGKPSSCRKGYARQQKQYNQII